MRVLGYIIKGIEFVSEWTGKFAALLVLPLMLGEVYEVVMRYGFNKPTPWAFDMSIFFGGSLFMLGAAWVLKQGAHVRVDLIWSRFPPRGRALVDLVFMLLIFFPLWVVVMHNMLDYAWESWASSERTLESFWRPIIYPFKTILPVAIFLLLFQAVATLIRNIGTAIKGEPCWT
ncbi:MAG TPA: TRAP transporter small permease subunit [Dehalococcoidia bacterium]|nr:TRAP transporter small permease subunit [Dehalococcoidia bacterium]